MGHLNTSVSAGFDYSVVPLYDDRYKYWLGTALSEEQKEKVGCLVEDEEDPFFAGFFFFFFFLKGKGKGEGERTRRTRRTRTKTFVLSLYFSFSLSLSLFLFLSFSLSLSLFLSFSFSLSLSLFLFLSFSLSLSLSLPLPLPLPLSLPPPPSQVTSWCNQIVGLLSPRQLTPESLQLPFPGAPPPPPTPQSKNKSPGPLTFLSPLFLLPPPPIDSTLSMKYGQILNQALLGVEFYVDLGGDSIGR